MAFRIYDGMNCRPVRAGLWLYSVTSNRASFTIKTLIVNSILVNHLQVKPAVKKVSGI